MKQKLFVATFIHGYMYEYGVKKKKSCQEKCNLTGKELTQVGDVRNTYNNGVDRERHCIDMQKANHPNVNIKVFTAIRPELCVSNTAIPGVRELNLSEIVLRIYFHAKTGYLAYTLRRTQKLWYCDSTNYLCKVKRIIAIEGI